MKSIFWAGMIAWIGAISPAHAIDVACTQTPNLSMYRCPENSTDWFESYTDIVDELDALAKTAKSSFTVQGNAFSVGASTFAVTGGNVGIGTASPATTLDVNGNAQFGSGATKSTFSATGSLTLDTNANLQVGTTFYVGNGRVGIGVTAPLSKLDVEGSVAIGATYSGTNVAPSNGLLVEGIAGFGTSGPSNARVHVQAVGTDLYAVRVTSANGTSEMFNVDTGGKVVIGALPAASAQQGKLEVTGANSAGSIYATRTNVTAAGTYGGVVGLRSPNADGTMLTWGYLSHTVNNPAAGVEDGSTYLTNMVNGDGNTVVLRSSGTKVLFGADALPNTTIDVRGNAQFGSGAAKSTFSATGSLTLDTNANLQVGTTFYVGNGRVGFGTSAPCSTCTAAEFVGNVAVNGEFTASRGLVLSCPTGQTINTVVVSSGIVTGGTCVAFGSGSGDAILAATQTWTGANTFVSSVSFTKAFSSYTVIANGASVTRATIGACFAGSTVTYTPQSSCVEAVFIGSAECNVGNAEVTAGVLVNGSMPSDWPTGLPLSQNADGVIITGGLPDIPIAVTAGQSTTFCLTAASNTGDVIIGYTFGGIASGENKFGVKECR